MNFRINLNYKLLFFTLLFINWGQANNALDSLINQLSITENRIKKIEILYALGDLLVDSDVNAADVYLNQALQLSNLELTKKLSEDKYFKVLLNKSEVLSELGYVSYLNSEYENSIFRINQSIKIKDEIGDTTYKSNFYYYLGVCYFKLGNYSTSIDYYKKSINYLETINEEEKIVSAYIAIGQNYMRLELFEKAIEIFEKAISLATIKISKTTLLKAYLGLSEVFLKKESWQDVKENLSKAKHISKKNKENLVESVYGIIAKIKIHENQLDSALFYLEKSEELCLKKKNEFQLINVYETYASIYLSEQDYFVAVQYANKLLVIASQKKDLYAQSIAYQLLYKIYNEQGDYKNALTNFIAYNNTQKKLAIGEAKNLLFKEEMNLMFSQEILEDSLFFAKEKLKKDIELNNQKVELKAEKSTKTLLYAGVVVLLAILIGLFLSFRRKKRDHELILKQKKEVELNQVLLANQNHQLNLKAILYKILKVCSSDLGIKSILKKSLEELLEINIIGQQKKGCILLLNDEDKPTLEVQIGLKEDEISKINKVSLEECLCGEFYTSSKIEYCTPESEQNHFNVPIFNNGIVEGIFILFTNLPIEEMRNAEEFLNSASILLGETISRHKISDKLRMAHIENTIKKKEIQLANQKIKYNYKKQQAINQLTQSIIKNENVGEQVYEYISDILVDVVIKRLNITLFDFDEEMVYFYFLRENNYDKIANKPFPLNDFSEETISRLKKGKAVVVHNLKDRKNKSDSDYLMIRSNINSFASFPLMMGDKLLGSLNLSFENDIKFDDEQKEFLNMLLEGVTIAIHQNNLFRDISSKNIELSALHLEINSSINYAKKLQQSVLPSKEYFDDMFPNKFVLLKQKDTVGGDFYWVREYEEEGIKMIACVDCTGHNIPGAFMTMLSRVLFREACTIKGLRVPSEVLKQMDGAIRKLFRQYSYEGMQDGLDMTIVVIDSNKNEFAFASAQRPIILNKKSKETLEIVKGSKFPIGGFFEKEKIFTDHVLPLNDIESFYMYSDGYSDQFGGPNIKKFGSNQFFSMINLINNMPMNKQYDYILNEFNSWKGELDQIDDICVIGVKL